MNIDEIKKLAAEKTPDVKTKIEKDFYRHNVADSLTGTGNVGIELGVAGGHFSKRMVDSGKFKIFYGVDLYADHHNTDQYKQALKFVGLESNYRLLRMSFDDAWGAFRRHHFRFYLFRRLRPHRRGRRQDFVDWFRKVKAGGVIAGDDYHDDWPLVKWAVNTFRESTRC